MNYQAEQIEKTLQSLTEGQMYTLSRKKFRDAYNLRGPLAPERKAEELGEQYGVNKKITLDVVKFSRD